jgi:peptide/nickel transport system substrate-binding protein
MRIRWMGVAGALCLLAVACGGDAGDAGGGTDGTAAEEGQADPNGVARLAYDLVAATRGGFTFDPTATTNATSDLGVLHWVYGALMRPTADGSLEPDLAESATVVDPNTIEVVMRESVTLSDGTPVDAEMVRAVLERNVADTDNAGYRDGFYSLEAVEVSGNTLTLTIADGTAASWHEQFLGGKETLVVPDGTDFDDPVGAGPFTVGEYQPGQRLVLERNPGYWAAAEIELGGIELIHAPPDNPQAAASALAAGQVDWARIDMSLVAAAGPDVEVAIEPDPEMLTQILVCKSDAPLDDVRVRQALSYAIDREAINEALFEGEGAPAWGLWPEGHPLYNAELTGQYEYDPEQARDLLAEAGAEDLSLDIIAIPGAQVPEVVQIVQEQWADVGVELNIVPSTSFVDDFLVGNNAPLGAIPRSSGGRANLNSFTGGTVSNVCRYQDPELDAMIADLAAVSDSSDEGVELWGQIQQRLVDEAAGIFVVFQPRVFGYETDRIGGYALLDAYAIPVPDAWDLYVTA